MDAQTTETVLLIHGTFATAPDLVGPRWWQHGPETFGRWLKERLGARFDVQLERWHFRWSGLNSERERRASGRALLEQLDRLEEAGLPFHLIAHSHGGSVVWEALKLSTRRAKPLNGLRSWTTVATPFLGFSPRASTAWLLFPILILGGPGYRPRSGGGFEMVESGRAVRW